MCGASDGLRPNRPSHGSSTRTTWDRLRHGVATALKALGFTIDEVARPIRFATTALAPPAPVQQVDRARDPREEAQSIGRAEAEILDQDMREPPVLKRFFEALSRAMYLTGHDV